MAPNRILDSPSPPSPEPGTVLTETKRLILRRLKIEDAPALAESGNHPEIIPSMSDRFPSPYTLENAREFIQMKIDSAKAAYPTSVGIFVKPGTADNQSSSEPRLIGTVGVRFKEDVEYRTWELGYFFTPSIWGKGYATEAVDALVRFCFATWPKLNRIQAGHFDFNEGSGKVLRKCGFTYEGHRRGVAEKNGRIIGDKFYGILRSDIE